MKIMSLSFLTIALMFAPASGFAAPTTSSITITSSTQSFSPGFTGELEKVVAEHEGVMGIYIKHVKSGETVSINADEPMPTASTIKVPVMCAALDLLASGNGPFKDYYETRTLDAATSVGGAGFLQNYRDGVKIELKEMMHLMITVSDNFATNMLVDWIKIDAVNNWLSANGFEQTRMFSTVFGRQVADQEMRTKWGLGRTTCQEMGRLFEMIYNGQAGTPASCDEMLRLLGHQYFDANIASQLPPTIWVGSKGGAVNDSRSNCAIVEAPGGAYVMIAYTKENLDKSWTKENKAEQAIEKVSALTWKHFEPESKWVRPAGAEKF